ncbi:MAG: hypothetical protein WCC87_22770 [Candidatus Korobacteraceae bacterium]
MTAKSEPRTLTLRQREGRAINAVAELLRNKLSVPNIYIEPRSSYIAADVLAVDRAGSGDLHAVEIKLLVGDDFERPGKLNQMMDAWMQYIREAMKKTRGHLMSLPVHYRYLAIPHDSLSLLVGEIGPHLYSPDGIGRIGIIAITDRGEEPPVAEISIAPERFRVEPAKLRNIEKKLLEKVRPDIEVRI